MSFVKKVLTEEMKNLSALRGDVAMHEVKEVQVSCPFCAAPITILIDTSVRTQKYVEDCEVCCRPMIIRYQTERGEITALNVEREEH